MEPRERFFFHLQEFLGRLAIFFIAPLYFIAIRCLGYRVRDLRRFRAECRRAFRSHDGPWLMCPNHLTMIDSVILTYAMASVGTQIVNYWLLPWNLPERDNFQRSLALTLLCYLTKCIPVNRGGDREELKKVLDKCTYLLRQGQNLMIFPEGGRSRTGRVDTENYSYGVGRFLVEVEGCRVMCLYLRGDKQVSYGTMPRLWQRFTVGMEVFEPEKPAVSGLGLSATMRGRSYAAWLESRRNTLPRVGNDIVDLTDPANQGKSRDTRFLNRVFTGDEQRLIKGAARPDAVLWALWAAKEAAYKVVSKVYPAIPSVPCLYEVTLDLPGEVEEFAETRRGYEYRAGEVRTPCGAVPVEIAIARDHVHCFGARCVSDARSILWQVATLAPDMAESADGPSQRVREMAAQAISRHLHRPLKDIAIRRFPSPAGFGPPVVFIHGQPADIDLSFSHDGRFTACAMIIPPLSDLRIMREKRIGLIQAGPREDRLLPVFQHPPKFSGRHDPCIPV